MKDNIFSIHNDLKEGKMTWKEAEKKLFILFDVVQQSELLFCYHKGSYTLNKDGTCCKCHRPLEPKAK